MQALQQRVRLFWSSLWADAALSTSTKHSTKVQRRHKVLGTKHH